MGTQTGILLQSRKKQSFSLPSFRKSPAGERQVEVARSEEGMAARTAEEAVRVQKAAAWQWYTRGVGDAVLPTKKPPPPSHEVPIDDKSVVDGISKAITNSNVLHKKPLEPPLAEFPKAASRFRAEARLAPASSRAGAQPPAPSSTPSDGPSTPLYDEFELSGLRTQMADFVQRLQLHQQTKDNQQSPAAQKSNPKDGRPLPAPDHQHPTAQKSNPKEIAVDGRPRPAPASVSTDQQHTKAPPSAPEAPISSEHQLPQPPPFAAPVSSTIPFHKRPFSALHRLFRKVISGSTKKSPLIINSLPGAVCEPEMLPDEDEENYTPNHYHHYIHHHHHHYHYGQSPEESVAAAINRSWRRHSESSGIRPHIPSLLEAESDEEEEEVERSSIEAYLARRRRHSHNFAGHLTPQKAAFDEEEEMKRESHAKEALPLRYNSERFSPNKIPMMASKDLAQAATDEFNERFLEIRSRIRQGASLESKTEGGGRSGGGTYKLGGAADGATPVKPLVGRRHSEGLQRPELEHVLERHIGASARRRDLPPLYPK